LDVIVVENTAYIVNGYGFSIIDVTNRHAPDLISFYDTLGLANGVAVRGDFAYIAEGGEGLRVLDISDPYEPFESGYYDLPGDSMDVALDDEYIYMATLYVGLTILRFTGPTPRGWIIVDKVTIPSGSPRGFSFTLADGPDDQDKLGFYLTDTSDPWNSGRLMPGNYIVSEEIPSGWVLSAATCDDGSDPSNIQLQGDEVVTCTFTNQKPPVANFTATPLKGVPPLTVDFTNLSTGDIDECLWDFGNGQTETNCDAPSIVYAQEGQYTVILTVRGPGGEDTKTIEQYINVSFYRIFLPEVMKAD
jgi:hypothetical protein